MIVHILRSYTVFHNRGDKIKNDERMYDMKKIKNVARWALSIMVILILSTAFGGAVTAHELWIEVEKMPDGEELKIDVMWGHIGDFLDSASHEDYELFVRTPGGQTQMLELERIGVQGRAYFDAQESGQYLFWALRQPGTFTPGSGITTLSVQLAKSVYQHGDGPGTAGDPTDILLEIIPETDLAGFSGGSFEGIVLLEGEPVEAVISAYGPSNETLEGESSADGSFELDLNNPGIWLVKANVSTEDEGTHDGEEYGAVSRTTTLVFTVGEESAAEQGTAGSSFAGIIVPLIIGVLLGGAGTLFFVSKKS